MILGALPNILDYYNKQFYKSALIATVCGSTSKEALQLPTLRGILPHCSNKDGKQPFGITFVNVEGKNERLENKKSWENKEEAMIVCSIYQSIDGTFIFHLKKFIRFLNRSNPSYQEFSRMASNKMILVLLRRIMHKCWH